MIQLNLESNLPFHALSVNFTRYYFTVFVKQQQWLWTNEQDVEKLKDYPSIFLKIIFQKTHTSFCFKHFENTAWERFKWWTIVFEMLGNVGHKFWTFYPNLRFSYQPSLPYLNQPPCKEFPDWCEYVAFAKTVFFNLFCITDHFMQ